jgi:hypothetical protein
MTHTISQVRRSLAVNAANVIFAVIYCVLAQLAIARHQSGGTYVWDRADRRS